MNLIITEAVMTGNFPEKILPHYIKKWILTPFCFGHLHYFLLHYRHICFAVRSEQIFSTCKLRLAWGFLPQAKLDVNFWD
jgi:hypothetical protein